MQPSDNTGTDNAACDDTPATKCVVGVSRPDLCKNV